MQNSGIGNIVNPVASLLNGKVYGIPCLFVVGWRGEPGVHDEPQHIFQGEVTVRLLEDMDIRTFVIGKETTEDEVYARLEEWKPLFASGGQAAFVVRKGALTCDGKPDYRNGYTLRREEVIRRISAAAGDDPIVCTTGKASRELFEIREARGEGHGHDFLTVGSMGHSSSIALELALRMPERRVWCNAHAYGRHGADRNGKAAQFRPRNHQQRCTRDGGRDADRCIRTGYRHDRTRMRLPAHAVRRAGGRIGCGTGGGASVRRTDIAGGALCAGRTCRSRQTYHDCAGEQAGVHARTSAVTGVWGNKMILRLPDSGKRLSYELERKAVGNINLRVRPDGSIYVSAPSQTPQESIESFLIAREKWILRALERVTDRTDAYPDLPVLAQRDSVPYLGSSLRVQYAACNSRKGRWSLDEPAGLLRVELPDPTSDSWRIGALQSFEKQRTQELVQEYLRQYLPLFAERGRPLPDYAKPLG